MTGRGYGGGGPPAGSDSYYGSLGNVDDRRNVMSNVTTGGFRSSRYTDGRENDVARGSEQDFWKSNSYSSFKGPEDMLRVTVGNQMYTPQGSDGPGAAAKDFGGDTGWGRAAGHQYQRTVQPVAGSLSHMPNSSGSSEWISHASRHHPDRGSAPVSGVGLQSQGSGGLGGWSSQASPSAHADVQGSRSGSSSRAAEYAESNEAFVDLRGAAQSAAEDRLRVLGLPSAPRDGEVVGGGRSSSADFGNRLGRAGSAQLWRPLMDVDGSSAAPFEADQGRLPASQGGPKSILKHKGLEVSQPDHVSGAGAGMGLRGVGDASISSGDAAAAYQAQSLLVAAAAAALQQAPAVGGGGATTKAQVFDYGHSKADPFFGNAEAVLPGDAGDRLLPSSAADRSGRTAEGNAAALATKNLMEDPTIAGILKSIGVDFDLNKKLQEKAREQEQLAEEISRRRRRDKTEEEMTRQFCINKTASFLEGDLDIGTVLDSSTLAGSAGAARPSKEAGTDHRTGPSSTRTAPTASNRDAAPTGRDSTASSGAHTSNPSPPQSSRPQLQQSRGSGQQTGSRDEEGSGSISWPTVAGDRSPGARSSSQTHRSSSGSADHGRQGDWQQRPLSDARHAASPSSTKGDYSRSSSGSSGKHGEARSAAEFDSTQQRESGLSGSGSAARGSQGDRSRSDSYGHRSVGTRGSKDGKGKSDRESSTGGYGSSREQRSATASGGGKSAGDGGSTNSSSSVGGSSGSSSAVPPAAGGGPLSIEEHERLADEMEDRRRRLQLLEGELEKLRRQQNEMMRRQQRGGGGSSVQKDGQLIAENARLQEEIGQQIAQLRRTAEANERALMQARMAAAAAVGSGGSSSPSVAAQAAAKSSGGDSAGHGSGAGSMLPPQIVQGDQGKALAAAVGNAATAAALFHTLLRAWPNLMLAASQSKQAQVAASSGKQLSEQQSSRQSPLSGQAENSSTSSSGGGGSGKQRQQQQPTSRGQVESMVYEYYDSTTHWCKPCNVELPTLGALLEHLSSQAHQQAVERPERPWEVAAELCRSPASSNKPAKKESSMIVKLPLKGSEFLVPAPEAFYCRLCSEFAGDPRSTEAHVKSSSHYENYKKHISENPYYERRYSLDREASARTRKRRLEEDARLADEAKRQRLDEEIADKKLELLKARRQQSAAAAVGASLSLSDDKPTAGDASIKLEPKGDGEVEAHAKSPAPDRSSGKSAEAGQGSTPSKPADVGASSAPFLQQPAKAAAATATAAGSSSSRAPDRGCSAEPSVTTAPKAIVPRASEIAKSGRDANNDASTTASGSAPKKMRLDETPEVSSIASKAGQDRAAEAKPAAAGASSAKPGAASAGRGSNGQKGDAGSSQMPVKPASAASISKPPSTTPNSGSGGASTQARPGSQKPTASAGAAEGAAPPQQASHEPVKGTVSQRGSGSEGAAGAAAASSSLAGPPPSSQAAGGAKAVAASSASASRPGPQSKADEASVRLGEVATNRPSAAHAGSGGAAVGASTAKPDPTTGMQPSVRLRPDDARVMARPASEGAKESATASSTTGTVAAQKGAERPPPGTASKQQQASKQTQEAAATSAQGAASGKSSAAAVGQATVTGSASSQSIKPIGCAGPVAGGNLSQQLTPGKPNPVAATSQQSSVAGSAAQFATKPAASAAPVLPLAKAVGAATSTTASSSEAAKPTAEPARGSTSQQQAKPGSATGSATTTQPAKLQATTTATVAAAKGAKPTAAPPAKTGLAKPSTTALAQSPKPGAGQASAATAPASTKDERQSSEARPAEVPGSDVVVAKSPATKSTGDAAKQGSGAGAVGTPAKPAVAAAVKVGDAPAKTAPSGAVSAKPGTAANSGGRSIAAGSGPAAAAPEAKSAGSAAATPGPAVTAATGISARIPCDAAQPASSSEGGEGLAAVKSLSTQATGLAESVRSGIATVGMALSAAPEAASSASLDASGGTSEIDAGGGTVSRPPAASKPHEADKFQAAAAVTKGTTPQAVKAGAAPAAQDARPSCPAGLPAQQAKPAAPSSSTGAPPAVATSTATRPAPASAGVTQAIKDVTATAAPSGNSLPPQSPKPGVPAGSPATKPAVLASCAKPAVTVQPSAKGPATSAKGPVNSAGGSTGTRTPVATGTGKASKTEHSGSPAGAKMVTAEPGGAVGAATDATSPSAQPALNIGGGASDRSLGGKPGVDVAKPEVTGGSSSTAPAGARPEPAGSGEARASDDDGRSRELHNGAAPTAKATADSRSAAVAGPASPAAAGPATRTRAAAAAVAAAGGGSAAQPLSTSRVAAAASGTTGEKATDEKWQQLASQGGGKSNDRGDGDLSDLEGDGSQMSEDQCDDASLDGDFEILDEYEEEHS